MVLFCAFSSYASRSLRGHLAYPHSSKNSHLLISIVSRATKANPNTSRISESGRGVYERTNCKNGTVTAAIKRSALSRNAQIKKMFERSGIFHIGVVRERNEKAINSESIEIDRNIALLSSSSGN